MQNVPANTCCCMQRTWPQQHFLDLFSLSLPKGATARGPSWAGWIKPDSCVYWRCWWRWRRRAAHGAQFSCVSLCFAMLCTSVVYFYGLPAAPLSAVLTQVLLLVCYLCSTAAVDWCTQRMCLFLDLIWFYRNPQQTKYINTIAAAAVVAGSGSSLPLFPYSKPKSFTYYI